MKKSKKVSYVFSIVKWDETGNILLEDKTMSVKRSTLYSARTAVRKKYSPKLGYFEELKTINP